MDYAAMAQRREAQAGVFTRAQALECGFSAGSARESVKRGRWVRVAGQGFVVAGHPCGPEQGAWAATLSVPGGTIWGPSALKLWRPDAPVPAAGFITVAKPGYSRDQYRIEVRNVRVEPSERTVLRGLAVQVQAAAFADTLAVLDPKAADALFGWAMARDLADPDSFNDLVEARRGRRNVRRLRFFAALLQSGAGSAAELELHLALRRRGIDGWEANAQIKLPDGGLVRADLLFRARKLVVEVDGWAAHGSRPAFQRDRIRQNALINAGYRILRFTWDDIANREQFCVDQIISALDLAPSTT